MFWSKKTALICISSLLMGCNATEKAPETENTFFSLTGFFGKEVSRLQKENPRIQKTVSQNDDTEVKILNISDWENELSLFSGSDINKASWINSYREKKTGNVVEYVATEPDLRTRKIEIAYSGQDVERIVIENKVNNMLYSSSEKLSYYPDSLYTIEKLQDVKIIGANHYRIEGRFNP